MATNNNLSIPDNNSNIAIVNTNSISDETIFENAIPFSKEKEIIESDKIKKEDEIKTLDFFDIIKKDEEKIKKEEERIKSLIEDKDIFSSAIEVDEPSTWEKMQYGWAKNDMVFGNLMQISQNFWEATLDSEKTFEETAIKNAEIEQKEFDEKYWKFEGGKHDGAYSFIGESLTYILDPYYLGAYILATPALIANPVATSVFLNAALLGGDNIIEQIAKQGKVTSWGSAGISAGIGAGIGLVLPVGGKILKKYLPSSIKDKAANVAKFIDEKIASKNKMSIEDVALIRSVANKESVKKITKQIDELVTSSSFTSKGSNFVAPVINAQNKYDALRSKLAKELKNIISLRKTTKKTKWSIDKFKIDAIKSQSKKILDLRLQGKLAKDAWKKDKERLLKRQVEKINKYYKLEGDRTAAILGQLTNNFNVGERFLHAILANLAKPLFGAFGGGAANVGASMMGLDVEDDIVGWMFAGALFGSSLKSVSNSLYKIPLQQKDIYGKIIKNTATRFTLQKIREFTAGTLATKLNSFGGTTQKIGRLLLRQIDDPMSKKSVIANADAMERYLMLKASKLLQNTTPEERLAAITINRGNRVAKDNASSKVLKLASDLKAFTDEINLLASKAGFKSGQKIEDYFPRVLNREEINKDVDKAVIVFTNIFKNNYKLDDKKAKAAAQAYLNHGIEQEGSVINKTLWNRIITGAEAGQLRKFGGTGDDLLITPMSEHIVQKRSLNGPYEIVEKILEKNNYLVNDLEQILPRMITDSVKSIAFARTFGVNGQLLKPLLLEIKNKYDLLPKERLLKIGRKEFTKQTEAKHEAQLVLDAVDAYFGKYTGLGHAGQFKSTVGLFTMLSNLNMLGRVTIASLGDIVQIFQHSSNFSAAVKGMLRTNPFRSKWEKGLAREMNLHFTNEMGKSMQRTAASHEGELLLNNKWIGNWGVKDIANPNLYNNLAFKGLGLEWLTAYARRFAYNAGTFDAYTLSRNYYKIVNGTKGINSKQAIKLRKDLLEKYGLKSSEALNIGKYKNLKASITNKNARLHLNDSGIQAANRDALIPQVDNRLLFTQSKTPWIRMLGQFLSWAQAKSASTNRMIKRIEDGDATLLIKTLATIPIYAGIQQLREYAKYGRVTSDWAYNKKELLSKSWQLSGMTGWLSDLIFNRFLGPGSKSQGTNYFVSFPALNMLYNVSDFLFTFISGDKKRRKKILDKKIAPIPDWRNLIQKTWFPKTVESGFSGTKNQGLNKGGRVGYRIGGNPSVRRSDISGINLGVSTDESVQQSAQVSQIDKLIDQKEAEKLMTDNLDMKERLDREIQKLKTLKNERVVAVAKGGVIRKRFEQGEEVILPRNKPMNKKDLAAAVMAATIATTGVNADMDKAVANNILPAKKPIIEKVEKVIEKVKKEKYIPNEKYKDYKNNFPGEPEKKDWLLDTAEKVYLTNKNNVIPNEIILAINSGETGWGTSGFLKKGSNNLFNIQVFDKSIPHIKATHSTEMIKKYDRAEDSIIDFLNMVNTSKKYNKVREEIKLYNEGKGSKNRIIDAIATTGYARDDDWAIKIKDILKNRIEGKEQNNLRKFANELFTGPDNKN